MQNIIGGSKGPNSFIFMQFSAKNLQNNRLAHPLWELAPPHGNLDPPLVRFELSHENIRFVMNAEPFKIKGIILTHLPNYGLI